MEQMILTAGTRSRFGALVLALATAGGCVGAVEGAGGTGGASSGSGSTAGSGSTVGNGSGGSGSGGSGAGGSGGSGASGATGSGGASQPSTDPLLPARIRRLTTREYDASVKALLGTSMTMGVTSFPPDSRQGGFTVNDAQRVDPVLAKQLSSAAETLVAEARSNGKLASLAPCSNATSGGEACAKTFIQSFGAAAYRRALTDDEIAALLTVYHAGADGGAYNDGIDLVVQATLQSAGFLYVTEIGSAASAPAAGAVVDLTPSETAATLSYLLTSAPPDSTMLTAASAGELGTPEGREKAARRLLQTPAAQDSLVRVVREWLGIDGISATDKDSTVYPGFAAVKDSFATESQSFVREVVLKSTGTIGELLSADWTVADAPLAKLYGVTAASSGHTPLGSTGRRGILNQGAFLSVYAHASESAPVFRGVAIMRRVACMTVPSPTELNIQVTPPMPDPNKTTRDRFAAHVSDQACAACHDSIDSIGFAFEKYDGMGAARPLTNGAAVENGKPVVTATVLGDKADEQKTDFDGAYADSDALAMALGSSAQVRACFARQLFRSSAGRSDNTARGAEEAFVTFWKQLPMEQQGNVIESLVAYVKNPTFAQRRAP
jgi:uncharacterized protein DUF1592/uncharacterized protein DUF1588/uncharacterized protein DUF1595/uncharacterized protein DUF1587